MSNEVSALQSIVSVLILWLMFACLPWGEDATTTLEKLLRWLVMKLVKAG